MRLLPIILLLLTSVSLFGQNTTKDVFASPRLTWFGLDFSKTKLINGANIPVLEDFKTRFVPSWNRLFIEEAAKYNLTSFFSKSLVGKDIKPIQEINKTIDEEELISYLDYSITDEQLSEMVKRYESDSENGIGLVFIVESLDKYKKSAVVHVTFFDIKNRNILYKQEMSGKPKGIGIRKYWAKAYFRILKECKRKWKKWDREVST